MYIVSGGGLRPSVAAKEMSELLVGRWKDLLLRMHMI